MPQIAVVPAMLAGRPIGAFRFGALIAVTFVAILALMVLVGGWRHRRSDRPAGEPDDQR